METFSWGNGNVPEINIMNPPRKDTIIIPVGAYAVLRIRSDNPGKWFLHCHKGFHQISGMAMVLSEAIDQAPNAPKGFPVCSNFYEDHSRNFLYAKGDGSNGKWIFGFFKVNVCFQ